MTDDGDAAGEWVSLQESEDGDTSRLAVPGGWLYRVRQWRKAADQQGEEDFELTGLQVVFVPEPPPGR